MPDLPLDKRFRVLCDIVRAQHFAWREAAVQTSQRADPLELVKEMWRTTGVQTADAYAPRLDPTRPLAPQVASSIVFSSECMGETATVEASADHTDEAFVRHDACPWFDWHERLGLLAEDRPGCDAWFAATIQRVNETLGSQLRFETLSTLPDGCSNCRRRIWNETESPKT